MKSKRSARLGLTAAIWLVLSVAVFGTLIGVAWMSMNAKADVSVGSPAHDAVDEKTTTQDVTRELRSDPSHPTPLGNIIWEGRLNGYMREPF
jgi:hypothetical protein